MHRQAEQRDQRRARSPHVTVIVPRPDRVRHVGQAGFAWWDANLLRQGWLALLDGPGLTVYAFLCLVADQQGVSWYRRSSMVARLSLDEAQVNAALERLRDLDLIAYSPFHANAADGFHQVLALPRAGPPSFAERMASLCSRRTF
jgi:hypothetical protein